MSDAMEDWDFEEEEEGEDVGAAAKGPRLTVFIADGGKDEEGGEGGEVKTYGPGEGFVVYRGMKAWVDSKIEIVDESPEGVFVENEEEEGLLPRGRYRWDGRRIAFVGRQKGPARPPG